MHAESSRKKWLVPRTVWLGDKRKGSCAQEGAASELETAAFAVFSVSGAEVGKEGPWEDGKVQGVVRKTDKEQRMARQRRMNDGLRTAEAEKESS